MRLNCHVYISGGKVIVLKLFAELSGGVCLGLGVFFTFSEPECNFLSSECIGIE